MNVGAAVIKTLWSALYRVARYVTCVNERSITVVKESICIAVTDHFYIVRLKSSDELKVPKRDFFCYTLFR